MALRTLDEALVETLRPIVKEMVEAEVERAGFEWAWKTPAQAGEILGIGAGAVRKRFREGRLPGRIEDGRIYIDMRAYDEQLRQGDRLP